MSEALQAVHETIAEFHKNGHVDSMTMRHFDAMCLTPVHDFDADDVQKLRKELGLSQSVFAEYLNVSKKLVQKWEQGLSLPKGPAAKLLVLAEKHGLQAIT
jgi:putative transcriptional regulator